MALPTQILWLFLLAFPIACAAWTVTHEEVFKELRDYCETKNQQSNNLLEKKFFYLLTCEYCFSHYVAIFFLVITKFKLLMDNWSGYVIAWFSLVWIANIYMGLFALIRQNIKKEKVEIKMIEKKVDRDKI